MDGTNYSKKMFLGNLILSGRIGFIFLDTHYLVDTAGLGPELAG